MRQGKWMIALLTLALLAVTGLCLHMDPIPETVSSRDAEENALFLEVSAGTHAENITPWKTEDNVFCVFLPAYAELSQVRLRVGAGCAVILDGNPVPDGMTCEVFQTDIPYALQCTDRQGNTLEGQIVFYQADAVPAVYVDVRSGSMAYIHQYKENEEPGSMRIYLPDGSLDYEGNLESVKGRGNATWGWEKKPYHLKLRVEADILDMGEAGSWILLANTYDPSHLRNRIVYEAADAIGLAYSPQCRPVDLYLNGEYAGLYLLTEKIELHSQRVDISKTSGNLISIEKKERLWEYGASQFVTDGGTPVRIRSTANPDALQQTLQAAERAILAPDGIDPATGKSWQELIDPESWAKKYLVEEVFGNLDAGYISQFFYWDDAASGKIHAGPVWDYDVTMGSPDHWQLQDANMLYAGRPHLENWEDTPWFYALYQKPEFRELVEDYYKTSLRPLLTHWLEQAIPAWEAQIHGSARMDRMRWNGQDPQSATLQLMDYMQRRMDFLDRYWLGQEAFCTVQLYIRWHVIGCYAIPAGTCIPYQAVPAGTDTIHYVAWCDADTGEAVDFSQPVTENRRIFLQEQESGENEQISHVSGLSGKIAYVPLTVMAMLFAAAVAVDHKRRSQGRVSKETINPALPEKSRR